MQVGGAALTHPTGLLHRAAIRIAQTKRTPLPRDAREQDPTVLSNLLGSNQLPELVLIGLMSGIVWMVEFVES